MRLFRLTIGILKVFRLVDYRLLTIVQIQRSFWNEHLKKQVVNTELVFAETMADRDFEGFKSFLSEEAIFFSSDKYFRGKKTVAEAWICGFYILGPLFLTFLLVGGLGLVGLVAGIKSYRSRPGQKALRHKIELLLHAVPLALVGVAMAMIFVG